MFRKQCTVLEAIYFSFFILHFSFFILQVQAAEAEGGGTGGLVGIVGTDCVPAAGADDVRLLYLADLHGRFRVCSFHVQRLLI